MKGNQLMRKPKLLRALLILLFVAAPMQWTRAQIVLSTPKTTLGAVIKNIKSQSNYQFFYDDKLAETPVNAIDVKNGSLQSVLDAALQGKGEGGNLAASKIRNLECPNYEICLIDYGCGKFNRKIHIMEQYP